MNDTFPTLCGIVAILSPALLAAILGLATLVGRRLSEQTTAHCVHGATGIGLIAVLGIWLAMVATDTRHVVIGIGEWVHFSNPGEEDYHFAVKFLFDRLSVPFAILTYVLCGTIGAFANRYMHRERGYNRFFCLYSLFLAGMVTTALAGTIETLFLGWELVGVSSALLVGFYHERTPPVRNALRVWVIYRMSDAALLTAAVFLHHLSGGGDFDKLTGYHGAAIESWPHGDVELSHLETFLVGGLLIFAAAGKSALVPFSGWLPRAMEGPTPSSAVFYGALSVQLGAFLLLRTGPIYADSSFLSALLVILGLLTAGFAALTGSVQTDIKSALSFASLTQVGLIVAEIGLGWRYVPLAHLIGHASLRTLQFLRAPNVIRDHNAVDDAIGGGLALSRRRGALALKLHRFAFDRGGLDAMLDRLIVAPFFQLFQRLDRWERAWVRRLGGKAGDGSS